MTLTEAMQPPWWESRANIAALIEWLDQTGCVDTAVTCDLLRHPEALESEWREFSAMLVESAAKMRAAELEDDSSLAPLLQASIAVARGARGVR